MPALDTEYRGRLLEALEKGASLLEKLASDYGMASTGPLINLSEIRRKIDGYSRDSSAGGGEPGSAC